MQSLRVPLHRFAGSVSMPEYATAGAAGMDLPAAVAEAVTIPPGGFARIPCGFAMALPVGVEAQIRPRSGLAHKHGVTVLNAPGTIDSDYRGEVQVLLINHGAAPFVVEPGMRIAQMIVAPVLQVQWDESPVLPLSQRAAGGFGHTGV